MLLTSHVYQFSHLRGMGIWGANVFLIVGTDLTLVDTGFKGRSAHILKQMRRLGYLPADITNIILTHHHADHTGSLAVLKEITGARVFAHAADVPYIDGRLVQPGPVRPEWLGETLAPLHKLWETIPAAVDVTIGDGDDIPALAGMKVLHTPGHTPGSISLYLAGEGLIIVGDVLSNTYGLSLPSKAFTVDMTREVRSIKRLANLEFDTISFGHGLPIRRKARRTIVEFADNLSEQHGF
jgi:glyoxylase-like metal-dependent hydrolase (beta-lactamase superfamily II)